MRLRREKFSRYRPRALTVVVLAVIATLIVLANLSFSYKLDGFYYKSYGWPLVWHRYVAEILAVPNGTIGWYYSASRLAANLAMWLVLLAAPGAACEWLLRRYRPRLRWRLRTMLVAIGLTAALCAWFAAARKRANLQEPLIAEFKGPYGRDVLVERWGPKWLDLVGADLYRREIVVAAPAKTFRADDQEDEQHLKLLAQLPKLRVLRLKVDRLSPAMTDALGDMRQLRTLIIERSGWSSNAGDQTISRRCLEALGKMARLEELNLIGLAIGDENLKNISTLKSLRLRFAFSGANFDERRAAHNCMQAVGRITQLEHLYVGGLAISSESLECLAGLTRLKSLAIHPPPKIEETQHLLVGLPAMPQLELLDLQSSPASDRDLTHLVAQPRLRSLNLRGTRVTAAGLVQLAPLESLEELAIDDASDLVSTAGLESLLAIKRLNRLHINRLKLNGPTPNFSLPLDQGSELYVPADKVNDFRRAIKALRRNNPRIVIDDKENIFGPRDTWWALPWFDYDALPDHHPAWLPVSDGPWMPPAVRAKYEADGRCEF
jgi:hypothetical protein